MVRLTYAENPGAFLSLGATWSIAARVGLFTIATGIMLLTAGIMAARSQRMGGTALGLTLFVAGGVSNWMDRFAHGSVVDWITVGIGPVRTGIFNVADVAILAGATIVAVSEVFRRRGWSPGGEES
jgi:signal peptidase II